MIKRILQNIFLSIVIFAFCLVLAEAVLSGAAYLYRTRGSSRTIVHKKDAQSVAILCLGDSFTFGMGAGKEFSYPRQLEKLLNQDPSTHKKYIVYNGGLPGNTTSKLLKRLDGSLRKYKPDICLLLIGANDSRHVQDIHCAFLKGNPVFDVLYSLWRAVLVRSRVCRVINFGWDSFIAGLWKRKLSRKHALFLKRAYRCGADENRGFDTDRVDESKGYYRQAEDCFNARNRNVQEALIACRKALEVWPHNTSAYLLMAQIYMGKDKAAPDDIDTAIGLLEKAIAICPQADLLGSLWDAYCMRRQLTQAREALEMYLCLQPDAIGYFLNILRCGFPPSDDHKTIKKVVSFNLREAMGILRRQGIKVVLQNYPHDDNWALFLGDVASANKVTFVDHRTVFKKLALTPEYRRDDYFAKDGHCNEGGYSVMAENIYYALTADDGSRP